MSNPRHLILVGAGHAHLHLISRLHEHLAAGLRVTVIAPSPFWYSGLGPAMLGGDAELDDDTVDVRALVERAGATFLEDIVTRILPETHRVQIRNHPKLAYDALSLNVGSQIAGPPGSEEFATPVKPISHLLDLRHRITARPRTHIPLRIVVVGAGDAGVEVTGNLRRLLNHLGQPFHITLVSPENQPLASYPPRAAKLFRASLKDENIRFLMAYRVTEIRADTVLLDDNTSLDTDLTVLATGVHPPELLQVSGLPVADDGALRVNPFLQNCQYLRIFGAGDCIHFEAKPLPRVGVHSVRQAPVLHHNLQAFLCDRPLRAYRPQSAYLLIRNLGDGTGLLTWRGLVMRSRWALQFKTWLDTRFVRQYQKH